MATHRRRWENCPSEAGIAGDGSISVDQVESSAALSPHSVGVDSPPADPAHPRRHQGSICTHPSESTPLATTHWLPRSPHRESPDISGEAPLRRRRRPMSPSSPPGGSIGTDEASGRRRQHVVTPCGEWSPNQRKALAMGELVHRCEPWSSFNDLAAPGAPAPPRKGSERAMAAPKSLEGNEEIHRFIYM
jgi:hypothetical protein